MSYPRVILPLGTPLDLLVRSKGLTLERLAYQMNVNLDLLPRVALQHQPLPIDLAHEMAFVLEVEVGTVLGAAGLWTPITGPAARVLRPPSLGDPPYSLKPIGQTQPVVPPVVQAFPRAWVGGAGLGPGGDSGLVRIDVRSGITSLVIDLPNTGAPVSLAFDGKTIYAPGNVSDGGGVDYWIAAAVEKSGVVTEHTNGAYQRLWGSVWEPATGTLWVASGNTNTVVQVDPETLDPLLVVNLSDLSHAFSPRSIVAYGGNLYVSGLRLTGNPSAPVEGKVFEIRVENAVVPQVDRFSVGLDLEAAGGLTVDDQGVLWVVSAGPVPGVTVTPKLCRVPIAPFTPALVPLAGGPSLVDPRWVSFLFGSLWVSDRAGSLGRLLEVDLGGNVKQYRDFSGSPEVGQVAAQGPLLWYADKGHGLVHLLGPQDIATTAYAVNVGGAPEALFVLLA